MKVIMVPVADRPECRLALDQAFRLASKLPANVVGYHLRPHREERHGSLGAYLQIGLEEAGLPELAEADYRLTRAHAHELFRQMAEEHGVKMARQPRVAARPLAFWNELVGTPERLFRIIGPTSDCIVVSRPKRKASGPARAFLLAALLNSGKPLLILPQRRMRIPGKRVLVAWDQGTQAAAALTAALPLLARAGEVHIVCCGEENLPGPKATHAHNYLLHWGIESRVHRKPGRRPETELVETYRALDCDLLVMGAYSRGHLRQRILGGVTHEMLTAQNLPVFALHA